MRWCWMATGSCLRRWHSTQEWHHGVESGSSEPMKESSWHVVQSGRRGVPASSQSSHQLPVGRPHQVHGGSRGRSCPRCSCHMCQVKHARSRPAESERRSEGAASCMRAAGMRAAALAMAVKVSSSTLSWGMRVRGEVETAAMSVVWSNRAVGSGPVQGSGGGGGRRRSDGY